MESTMTKLAVFSFGNQEIRTATDEHGEIWFVANDVCGALELVNPHKAVADHVDPEDLTRRDTLTPGGKQAINHVNESGLYALIFGSRKEAAKRFKRWVTSEVLPAIRKNGQYAVVGKTSEESVALTGVQPTKVKKAYGLQWYDCPARPIDEDFRKVEMLAQFAGLSQADKLTALAMTVVQHDEYFASVILAVKHRVKELDEIKLQLS
jgi:prophage antirepressor-like protein